MNRIRLTSDLAASLVFIVIGVIAFGGALHYRVGTATNMGPGWFPAALAIVLFLLGVGSAIKTLIKDNGETLKPVPITPLIAILIGLVVFGVLLDNFGLMPATTALVVIACYDRIFSRPLEVLAIAATLTVGSAVLFIYFLGLPITLW